MHAISTNVETAFASKYLQQLCKHFAHKVPSVFDPHKGEVTFPFGNCVMQASEDRLFIHCQVEDEDNLARARGVIDSHLERFAWKEKPTIAWEAASPRPSLS